MGNWKVIKWNQECGNRENSEVRKIQRGFEVVYCCKQETERSYVKID